MNVTTPFKRLPIVAKSLGIGLFLVSSLLAATQPLKIKYDTLIYVPVTLYDYHPDKNLGFELCMAPAGTTVFPGMVENTIQLPGGKPVRTALACNTNDQAAYPCACALNDWFKPTGYQNAANLKFNQVQTVYKGDTISAFRWTGLVRNTNYSTVTDTFWTLPAPAWNGSTPGANIVYYSYLPFKLTDPNNGTYEFDRTGNNQFFWLDNIGYGNEGLAHNFSFTMELHQEFTYQGDNSQKFSFSGDDDVWVYVNGQLVIDLGGVHGEQSKDYTLTKDEATKLGLVVGKKYWLDVFYTERHTIQSNCRITSNLLRPYIDKVLIADCDNLCPGDTINITGRILDKDSVRMTWLEDSIRWEVISPTNLDVNDKLIKSKGPTARFTATQAWRNISIRAWVYDPYIPDQIKSDTVTFSVDVCKADHIVIEGSPTPRKWGDDSLGSVLIGSTDTLYTKLYAVVRDSFGNLYDTLNPAKWFTSSTTTNWTSANTKIATVLGENGKKYHGIATRADTAGDVKVTASDGILKPGSVIVKVADYYIVKLRLIDLKTGNVVDTVKVETDSTGRYKIQGLKSTFKNDTQNPNAWVDVQGKVDLKDTLKTDCPLTVNGNTWDYCPSNHGTGRVILTNPNDTNTATTILPVIVTLSQPKLYLEILTPPLERIAGDSLKIRAYIKNDDGLIPIPYCFGGANADIKDSISYFDNLGRGGASKPEGVTFVNGKLPFNFDAFKYQTTQCFQNGSDTFNVVLYYAPFFDNDSLHVIKAIAGNRQAETEKFKLYPGPLYKIKLENNNWVEYQGPIYLNPVDSIFSTYSNGYDKYGNLRGHQPSEWSVDGSLDPEKMGPKTGDNSFYHALNEKDGAKGKLIAQAKGINDSLIIASIDIIVLPPQSNIVSVFTRDINGNGRLDRIDITFHKKTRFVKDEGNISITNSSTSTSFTDLKGVDSIVPVGVSGLEYYIYFPERQGFIKGVEVAQTGWTPKLVLTKFSEIADANVTVKDGAAPVIWKAHKQIVSTLDRKKDVISIIMSEKIAKGGGSNLITFESDPPMVLKIWEKNASGAFVYEDFMLKGIDFFDQIRDSSTANATILVFKMSNAQDISDNDWVNIFFENRLIADENSNYTHELNQKVPFVIGGKGPKIEIIPNPASPTTAYGTPGKLEYVKLKSDAYEKVIKGGAIIKITVPISTDSTVKDIRIKIKMYDIAGNQVASLEELSLKALDIPREASTPTMYLIYPGTNEQGMKVAPGRYKLIAWFNYDSKSVKDQKLSLEVGFKK